MLQGIGASQGYGIGKAVIIEDISLDYSAVKYTTAEEKNLALTKRLKPSLPKQEKWQKG